MKEITLTDEQQERIAAIQEQSTEGGQVPELPVSAVIDSLLDTWDAVDDGHYTEDHTANSDLREFVKSMRTTAEGAANADDYTCANVVESLAEELEQVLENE